MKSPVALLSRPRLCYLEIPGDVPRPGGNRDWALPGRVLDMGAGVEHRAAIQAGDMRQLPFAPSEFDGVVSTCAIDHLNGEGINTPLREALRVLKPGGGGQLQRRS